MLRRSANLRTGALLRSPNHNECVPQLSKWLEKIISGAYLQYRLCAFQKCVPETDVRKCNNPEAAVHQMYSLVKCLYCCDNQLISMIAQMLRCSKSMVFTALKVYRESESKHNSMRLNPLRKTTPTDDLAIVHLSKLHPFMTSTDIQLLKLDCKAAQSNDNCICRKRTSRNV